MIAKNIREIRTKKDFSLRSLAEKAKISKSTLSDIENEKTNPTITTLNKIADALEVPLDYLIRKSVTAMIEDKLDKLNNTYDWNQIKKEANILDNAVYKAKNITLSLNTIPKELTTPQAAMQFILKQPSIMDFAGFDTSKISDDELMEFANELLRQLKLISYKYKK